MDVSTYIIVLTTTLTDYCDCFLKVCKSFTPYLAEKDFLLSDSACKQSSLHKEIH